MITAKEARNNYDIENQYNREFNALVDRVDQLISDASYDSNSVTIKVDGEYQGRLCKDIYELLKYNGYSIYQISCDPSYTKYTVSW